MAPRRDYRPHAALIGGGLLIAAFWSAGAAAGDYTILYGRHGWSGPETAFLLNFVLLGLPGAGLLSLALAGWSGGALGTRFEGLAMVSPATRGRCLWIGAVLIGVLITLARYGLLRDAAITDDEHVYDFMARVWERGRLFATSPPAAVRAFFENQFVVNNGRWYGIYAPGHPLVLTLGQWLGLIRWVTTVEAVLTVPVAWALTRRLFGDRAGLLMVAGLAISPFFILVSATMLAHPTATLALTVFTYAALRVLDHPESTRWWVVAGTAVAYAGLTRPLTAAAFVLPWLVAGVRVLRRPKAWRGALAFAGVALGGAGLLLAYNAVLTGHPLRTGYHVFADTYHFSFTQGSLPVAAPLASLYELFYALARLNFWLLGWPLSLVFVPFALRVPGARPLAWSVAGTLVAYATLRIPSINVVGPVHYAELTVPLLALSAGGLGQAAAWARDRLGPLAGQAVIASPIAGTIVAALSFWPVYAPSLRLMADVARAPYDLVERAQLDNAVVFVGSLPALESVPGAWVYRPRNNTPDLSDRVLFVNDLRSENRRLLPFLPGRKPYRLGMERGALVLAPLEEPPPRPDYSP